MEVRVRWTKECFYGPFLKTFYYKAETSKSADQQSRRIIINPLKLVTFSNKIRQLNKKYQIFNIYRHVQC